MNILPAKNVHQILFCCFAVFRALPKAKLYRASALKSQIATLIFVLFLICFEIYDYF